MAVFAFLGWKRGRSLGTGIRSGREMSILLLLFFRIIGHTVWHVGGSPTRDQKLEPSAAEEKQ